MSAHDAVVWRQHNGAKRSVHEAMARRSVVRVDALR